MEKLSDKNLKNGGWYCCHCGSHNKVAVAKFCGHCGTKRDLPNAVTSSVTPNTSENISIKSVKPTKLGQVPEPSKQSTWERIKSNLLLSPEKAFKVVIGGACGLLLSSVLCGYTMYYSTNTIRLTQTKFSDISIDHPIYDVCHSLLEINAIGFRKNRELAPFEEISPREWNHVLNQASKRLEKKYSESAYFSSNETVTVKNLNNKLQALNKEGSELTDTSRIQSFYILEQTLFN